MSDLGNAIKTFRVSRRLSQSELAEMAEISVSYLSLLERNQRDPVFSTLQRIASACDVPLITLIFLATDTHVFDKGMQEKIAHHITTELRYS